MNDQIVVLREYKVLLILIEIVFIGLILIFNLRK